ncbi:hypothetical protein [Petroclostridium sp. X23]|uniref:hypothetical protein n=1 Tax=Petroclostridium sp. X23 TaxID=3045146 RepID=UPI0024AE1CA6|nr:hypothetical protein [Petroclostridium sp. X23]WHH58262.1 hypothetical protein QKW49_21060 [Petroclostridium sp. X23]
MNKMLSESQVLSNYIFTEKQKEQIQEILNEIRQHPRNYSTQAIWVFDSEIGGIGAYCMPANPVYNPFPGGINRSLFRPLQYARSEIDIQNIHLSARYVIQYSGMHLESLMRLILSNTSFLGHMRFYNSTFGKAVHKINQRKLLPKEIIDALYKFIPIYNISKHEINHSNERERLFDPADALISYFAARIIGYRIILLLPPDSVPLVPSNKLLNYTEQTNNKGAL